MDLPVTSFRNGANTPTACMMCTGGGLADGDQGLKRKGAPGARANILFSGRPPPARADAEFARKNDHPARGPPDLSGPGWPAGTANAQRDGLCAQTGMQT